MPPTSSTTNVGIRGEHLLNVAGPEYIVGDPVHALALDIAVEYMGQPQIGEFAG